MKYGLKDNELGDLCSLFAANCRVVRAVLYGSRAKGNYKPFSDIDITLMGDDLTHHDLLTLCQAIDDLLMPYETDLSLYKEINNPALLEHINRNGITLYSRSSGSNIDNN
ncbi:MAG: nucleotidyltransferase domain-containing protein [Bacteroidales bacterium]|nr:nucleotidyltransferase domain-containing protein [Bacteroidales bacterium]